MGFRAPAGAWKSGDAPNYSVTSEADVRPPSVTPGPGNATP